MSWQRPPGCACPVIYSDGKKVPQRDRCSKRWMRCNERIAYEREKKLAALGVKLPENSDGK